MAKQNVLMPQMGESIQEGTITKWHKKVGDPVQQDELLLEISTDKVDTEIPSPFSGVLTEILAQEGSTVKVNSPIAIIDTQVQASTQASGNTGSKKEEVFKNSVSPVENKKEESSQDTQTSAQTSTESKKTEPLKETSSVENARGVMASPLARKIAREHSLDLQNIKGTGDGNKIVKEDVLSALQNPPQREPASFQKSSSPLMAAATASVVNDTNLETLPDGTRIQRVRMSAMRKKIAEHMVMSKRVSPHVTSVIEIDVQKIVDFREKNKGKFESQYGFKLTFMPFFMDAVLKAIKAVPIVNSSVEGDDTIIYKKDVHLGIAVALESGLIVPVIKNAHEKNFVGLGHELTSLADKARNKKLLPEDVRNGTFSITSFGGFGTVIGQPIINQPQVAIFGIGAMQKKPVVVNDAIAIRTMCYCVLSFDHRVIDGSDSGRFLSMVKKVLENWDTAF